MSIKVKNSQLDKEAISYINFLIDKDINATTAFKLSRIVKDLSSIVDDKLKMEKKILDKWVEKDENGNPVNPTNEKGEVVEGSVKLKDKNAFNEEMESLMEIENTIPFDKIKFENLGLEKAKVKDLLKVEFLFE